MKVGNGKRLSENNEKESKLEKMLGNKNHYKLQKMHPIFFDNFTFCNFFIPLSRIYHCIRCPHDINM